MTLYVYICVCACVHYSNTMGDEIRLRDYGVISLCTCVCLCFVFVCVHVCGSGCECSWETQGTVARGGGYKEQGNRLGLNRKWPSFFLPSFPSLALPCLLLTPLTISFCFSVHALSQWLRCELHSKSNDAETLTNSFKSACCRWYAKVPPQEFKFFIQEMFPYLAKSHQTWGFVILFAMLHKMHARHLFVRRIKYSTNPACM